MRIITYSALITAAIAMLGATMPASAVPERAGKQTGKARSHVQKPTAHASQAKSRSSGNRSQPANRNNNAKRGDKNVVAGNTVVVGGQPGRGYYDDGRYHGSPDWDDDDNDFLEFVGKTAAVTAGVSVVSAVIGSVVQDKPDDCEPISVGGQQYLNCNGVAYQQVAGGYQVVEPPQ